MTTTGAERGTVPARGLVRLAHVPRDTKRRAPSISSGVLAMAPAGGKNGSSGMNLDPTFLMFSLIPGGNFTGGTTVLAGVGVLLGGVLCLMIRAGW